MYTQTTQYVLIPDPALKLQSAMATIYSRELRTHVVDNLRTQVVGNLHRQVETQHTVLTTHHSSLNEQHLRFDRALNDWEIQVAAMDRHRNSPPWRLALPRLHPVWNVCAMNSRPPRKVP